MRLSYGGIEAMKTTPSVRDYLRLVFRRKWALLIPFAAGVISVAPLWALTPSKYRAGAIVQRKDLAVLRSAPASLVSRETASMSPETLRVEILTLASLDAVLTATHLDVGLDAAARQSMHEKLRQAITIQSLTPRARGVDLIEIAVIDSSPSMAKEIANVVADTYKKRSNDIELQDSGKSVQFLEKYAKQYQAELTKAEKDIEDYRKAHLVDLPQVRDNLMKEKLSLQTEKAVQLAHIDDATKRLAEAEKQLAEVPKTVQMEVTTEGNPRVVELQNLLNQKKTLLDALLVKLTDEHPAVKQLRAEISSVEKELADTPQRQPGTEREGANPVYQTLYTDWLNLRREVQGAKAGLLQVETSMEAADKRLKELGQEEQQYNELVRRRAEKLEYYDAYNRSLIAARTRLQVDQGEYGTHVDILQYAIEPVKPYYFPLIKLGLACIVGGIALGVALMFGLEYCDRSFRDMEDAAAYLDVPILGSICTIALPRERRPPLERKLVIAGLLAAAVILLSAMAVYCWNQMSPGAPRALLGKLTHWAYELVARLLA